MSDIECETATFLPPEVVDKWNKDVAPFLMSYKDYKLTEPFRIKISPVQYERYFINYFYLHDGVSYDSQYYDAVANDIKNREKQNSALNIHSVTVKKITRLTDNCDNQFVNICLMVTMVKSKKHVYERFTNIDAA